MNGLKGTPETWIGWLLSFVMLTSMRTVLRTVGEDGAMGSDEPHAEIVESRPAATLTKIIGAVRTGP